MATPERSSRSGSGSWLPSSWHGRAILATWLAALLLWLQFSIASVQELETQAAALGAIMVVILLAGGLTVWAARIQTRDR